LYQLQYNVILCNQEMLRQIKTTTDGSTTIHLPEWDESYHSKHGAIQEAYHVFIKNGLSLCNKQAVAILEIGFGTGLNAFITYLESKANNIAIEYTGVEAYPISQEEVFAMNYVEELQATDYQNIYGEMHECLWEEKVVLDSNFSLTKRKQFFDEIKYVSDFDLIYFDAFGYRVQPELWSTLIFQKMFDALKEGGILVTYAARGVVKRSMEEVGFTVKKVPGPPGKREMMIALK
jgi:tRNA U34 5-methylaminomethyl-2-thiouridine-forming methyltransferase MnmC